MRTLRFDSVGGASGDMILSSLCALGVKKEELASGLASLHLGNFSLEEEAATSHGLQGTRLSVKIHHEHHPPHRNLPIIRKLIEDSALPDPVKKRSVSVFERLAAAEAEVHKISIDKVHFHEVGATDAIIDITASCLALHILEIESVLVGPLPVGTGTVECAHGALPLPAPATVRLLDDHPIVQTTEPFELVTPTGAALLMTWKAPGSVAKVFRIVKSGNGIGHHALQHRPNLLRASILETDSELRDEEHETCLVLECNVDDTTPELVGNLVPRLMEAGSLDAFTTPVQMKKQRPGVLLTVLCHTQQRDALVDLIFSETTTFGIREYAVRRTMLKRHSVPVSIRYGTVHVKIGTWKGNVITRTPEYEDCVCLAEEHGVPVRVVYQEACAAAQRIDDSKPAAE